MQSETIKKIGYGVIIGGIVLGILAGNVFKVVSISKLNSVFNWGLMLSMSFSGIVSGFFIHVLAAIMEHLEYIVYKMHDADENKRITENKKASDMSWICTHCGTRNSNYSMACSQCNHDKE